MRSKIFFVSYTLVLFCIASISAVAQASKGDWMRVQTDDGEFSIEVPANYKYYFNDAGFSISRLGGSDDYWLKKMRMFNSYDNGSLLSFEIYEAKRGALDAFYDHDTFKRKDIKTSTIKNADFTIKEIVTNNGDYYCVRRYFASKNNIYILTTGSRIGETTETKRFLESLVFTPNSKVALNNGSVRLSSLHVTEIAVSSATETPNASKKPTAPQNTTSTDEKDKLILLSRPRPSYVETARTNHVTGTIRVKAEFGADGFIPVIAVSKELSRDLLREALFAVIRIKFLPVLKDGKPISVVKTIEYSFDIY